MSTSRPIKDLHNWDRNPRGVKKDDFERLKRLITKLGIFKPFIITEDGTVLGGNMRLLATKELIEEGKLTITEVPVVVVDALTEERKIEYALADNDRVGYYEDQALAELITGIDIDLGDYKVDLGQPISLTKLLEQFGPDVEEDEAPEVSNEPAVSQLGEVYQLGRHRLMCGDATKIEDVEKLMDGKRADMVFTDPPYNVAGESKNFASDVSKSMNDLKGSEWDKGLKPDEFLNILPVFLNENSTIYIFTSHFLFGEIYSQLKTWNDFVSYCVWNKPNPMPSLSKRHWTWNTELCVYAVRGNHTFNFPNGEHALSGWITNKKSDGTHPTQKPIELCVNPITRSSKQDDVVLDLFGGSGSTLIACEQTNRICYMMELDPKYCDVIRKRYAKFIGNEEQWETTTPLISK